MILDLSPEDFDPIEMWAVFWQEKDVEILLFPAGNLVIEFVGSVHGSIVQNNYSNVIPPGDELVNGLNDEFTIDTALSMKGT